MLERNALTFLNAPAVDFQSTTLNRISLMGIPTERGHIFRGGTSQGPEAVRKTSLMYYYPDFDGLYDPERNKYILEGDKIGDFGDITDEPLSTFNERVIHSIKFIREKGSIPVAIGGDHSITYSILQAYDTQFDVVHLDAHSDCQGYDETATAECGLVMRRANELPSVRRIIHAGIRGYLNSGQGIRDSQNKGNIVIPCDMLRQQGANSITEHIGELPIYISFDSDILDPSICPGTTVPEPGGINYALAKDILIQLAQKGNVIGADFVELSPPHDPTELGSFHLTKLILDFLGEISES